MRFLHTFETLALACRHACVPPQQSVRPTSLASSESVSGGPWVPVSSHPERAAARRAPEPKPAGRSPYANACGPAGEGVGCGRRGRGNRLLPGLHLSLGPGLRRAWDYRLARGVTTAAAYETDGAQLGGHRDHRHPPAHLLELQAHRVRDGAAPDLSG